MFLAELYVSGRLATDIFAAPVSVTYIILLKDKTVVCTPLRASFLEYPADSSGDAVQGDPSTNPWGALRPTGIFCFYPCSQQAGQGKNKKYRALRAQGLVEVGGGFEPP